MRTRARTRIQDDEDRVDAATLLVEGNVGNDVSMGTVRLMMVTI